ncbi:ABC transporter ATP-binding protein [soil metagenome]
MSELVVRGLVKSFGDTAVLRGIDLRVPTGSLAAVLGPSGGCKTTLLRVIAGFECPDDGRVELAGATLASRTHSVAPEKRRVGIVPQEGALFPHLSVGGNAGYALSRAQRRGGRVAEVLELVGLAGYADRMPHELSGGQQQRVAVARALAPRPALILLDEPFSALDTGMRAEVRADVGAALRADGATAVLVTHDQEEALSTADLVAVMRDGVMVQAAAPMQLYRAPADLGVATFVGDTVLLAGTVHGRMARTAFGRLPVREPVPAAGAVQVVVRPEQLVLSPDGAGVCARVREQVFLGHDALIRLELADGALVTARSLDSAWLEAGVQLRVTVRGEVTCYPAE